MSGNVTGVPTCALPIYEYRNEVVDWVKENYEGVKTRLGQPILKLPNMVIEFRRVVKS